MSLLVVALALMSALTGLGLGDFRSYFFVAFHMALGLILLIEVEWKQYLNKSTYKSLNATEILGLLGSLLGGATVMSALLAIPLISSAAPLVVVTFLGNTSAVVDIVVALLAIVYMFI